MRWWDNGRYPAARTWKRWLRVPFVCSLCFFVSLSTALSGEMGRTKRPVQGPPNLSKPALENQGLADAPWPKFLGNVRNTSQSRYPGATKGQIRWQVDFKGYSDYTLDRPETITVNASGQIFAVGGSGFQVFQPSGSRSWAFSKNVGTAPTIDRKGNREGGITLSFGTGSTRQKPRGSPSYG